MSSFISSSFHKLKDTFPGQWFDPRSNSSLTFVIIIVHCYSVIQSCPTLCDPMDCSMPGFPVLHCLPEFAQTRVHWVSDAIQSFHPLLSPFSSCLQSFPTSESFPVSRLFTSGSQSIGASASSSVLPMKYSGLISFRMDWLDLLAVPRDSQKSLTAPQSKSINSTALSLL